MNTLFDIPLRGGRESDNRIVKKAKAKKRAVTTKRGGNGILNRISEIKLNVESNLGKYKEESEIIRDLNRLHEYIDKCIENKVVAIDTETDGLDPMLNHIAGVCLYTPNEKTTYIPLNHISYITGEKVPNQLAVELVKREMDRLKFDGMEIIMFNGSFDMRVLRNQVGTDLPCTWDCYLATRVLNENEPSNRLKDVHQKYVLKGEGDAFTFDKLFKGIPFTKIPIDVGYLYASHDPKITYELYDYQKQFLDVNSERCKELGLEDLANVFHNIEMPCLQVVARMEDTGIELDLEYAKELSVKYNTELDRCKKEVHKMCSKYQSEIDNYNAQHGDVIDNPINIDSPKQLQALLYDVLGYDAGVDKKTKKPIRGTGEDVLKSIDKPICKAILEYRKCVKLVSTYIDKLPTCVNPNDGRIHCKFNQYGADTGRFSSSNPKINWALM